VSDWAGLALGLFGLACSAVGGAVTLGVVYGRFKERLCRMEVRMVHVEDLLGEGDKGVVVRKAELALVREKDEAVHSEHARRLEVLEQWRSPPH
jgi:hypothetical protein